MADEKKTRKTSKEIDELKEKLEEVAEELEEVAEELEETEEEAEVKADSDKPAMKVSTANKREKKKADREAKAARKAANVVEEKKKRPNNVVLAVLIFGVLILMFAFVQLYNYYSKPASIQDYLEENADQYTGLMIDYYTTADLTAEGNSLKVDMSSIVEDESVADMIRDYYLEDEEDENLKYIGAYFLTDIKPQVRGRNADVTVTMSVNGEEIKSVTMTYQEAEDYLEELLDEDAEDADAEEGEADDVEEGDVAGDEDTGDDAADDAEGEGEGGN